MEFLLKHGLCTFHMVFGNEKNEQQISVQFSQQILLKYIQKILIYALLPGLLYNIMNFT